jgi:glucan phosphoethanolaminetransferase (alkaline phosphatase superfamily)
MFLSFFAPLAGIAKIVIPFLVGGICICAFAVWETGRIMARHTNDDSEYVVSLHKKLLWAATVMLLFIVIFAESLARTTESSVRSPLFWPVHIPLVLLLLILGGLAVRYNGKSAKKYLHRYFVYPALVCLFSVLGTGLWLVFM